MNVQSHHKWLSTIKSDVRHFRLLFVSSSLPPFVSGGGGLVCESVGMADLLLSARGFFSSQLDSCQRLLLDLDYYGGTVTLGMFPLFSLEN